MSEEDQEVLLNLRHLFASNSLKVALVKAEALISTQWELSSHSDSPLREVCNHLLKRNLLNPYTLQVLHKIPTYAVEAIERITLKNNIPMSIRTGSGILFQIRRMLSIVWGRLLPKIGISTAESKWNDLVSEYESKYDQIKNSNAIPEEQSIPVDQETVYYSDDEGGSTVGGKDSDSEEEWSDALEDLSSNQANDTNIISSGSYFQLPKPNSQEADMNLEQDKSSKQINQ